MSIGQTAINMAGKLAPLLRSLGLTERRCINCRSPFIPDAITARGASSRLCPHCNALLEPYSGPKCHLCGLPAANRRQGKIICQNCAKKPPLWDQIAYHGLYEGHLRDLLLRLKFDGELHIAPLLADFLLEAAAVLPLPSAIVAMPQHPRQLRKRGYNQAYELARGVARQSGLPIRRDLLARIKPGLPQEQLNAAQRRANLASAFRAAPAASGKVIWLVDDVLTTGSTCEAAASALKAAGALAVHALFAARTPLH